MTLLAVILHYGDVALTRAVHMRLLQGAPENTVLVLDNAAPMAYPQAMRLPHNVYWGGGLDVALTLAKERGAEYLWFCNNDIAVHDPAPHIPLLPFVQGRLGYMQRQLGQCVGIVAPAVKHNMYHPQMRHNPQVDYARIAYVDGIAPILHVETVCALGLDMGENLRGYGVDVWLSLRMHTAGWPVLVDHRLCLRHRYHTTAKQVPGFMHQAAIDENAYLTARIGKDWRTTLQQHQALLTKPE